MKRLALSLVLALPCLALGGESAAAPAQKDPKAAVAESCRYAKAEFEMDAGPAVRLGAVTVEALAYPSPVASVDPDRNDTVRAKLFRRAKDPLPALVVVLGGWKFDPFTPDVARRLAEDTGVQTLLVEIPFQGQRTPKGQRPGDVTLSSDLDQTEASFVQLAQDVARGVEWAVRERGVAADRVGLLGTSLGGYAAATLYGMTDRYRCAVVQLAGGDISSVLFNPNWLTRHIGEDLRRRNLTPEQVRERLAGINPASWARPERGAGLLLVAAGADEIVPIDTVRDLAKRYGDARLIVAEGATHVEPDRILEHYPEVREHVERCLVAREEPATRTGESGDPAPDETPAGGR